MDAGLSSAWGPGARGRMAARAPYSQILRVTQQEKHCSVRSVLLFDLERAPSYRLGRPYFNLGPSERQNSGPEEGGAGRSASLSPPALQGPHVHTECQVCPATPDSCPSDLGGHTPGSSPPSGTWARGRGPHRLRCRRCALGGPRCLSMV